MHTNSSNVNQTKVQEFYYLLKIPHNYFKYLHYVLIRKFNKKPVSFRTDTIRCKACRNNAKKFLLCIEKNIEINFQ